MYFTNNERKENAHALWKQAEDAADKLNRKVVKLRKQLDSGKITDNKKYVIMSGELQLMEIEMEPIFQLAKSRWEHYMELLSKE
jgi:hypothetical protein